MSFPFGKIGGHVEVLRHAHLFVGMGSGAQGFNQANPRVGNVTGRFECAGGIDNDVGALRQFERLTGVKGTLLDLFDREQYEAFHGRQPPAGWMEAAPADIRRAFGDHLDFCFLSAPCKGFSGLLSTQKSKTDKYQALNRLTLRGIWLLLEAYKDDPVTVLLFENVPRIQTRGSFLLDEIKALVRAFGYHVADDNHDCGEVGNLAQSRKRYLMIARHPSKMPAFIYQPPKHRLRGVGEVIGKLPLPGDPLAGTMHRVPALQWQTWVRLAFVEAGKDWRSLQTLRVEDGVLKDFGIMPEVELRDNALGVCAWGDTGPLITGQRSPLQGRFSVADIRTDARNQTYQQYGVASWDHSINAVSAQSKPGGGRYSVADIRIAHCQDGAFGVRSIGDSSFTVRGRSGPTNGPFSIADPRPNYAFGTHQNILSVVPFDGRAKPVTGARHVAGGALSVADVRPFYGPSTHRGVLGVNCWDNPTGVISGDPHPTGGAHSVADVRVDGHPKSVMLGVRAWGEASPCVKGDMSVGGGPYAIADVRISRPRFNNCFRVVRFADPGPAVAGPGGAGGSAVADPRPAPSDYSSRKYKVTPFGCSTRAVIGASTTGDGAFAVADPRCNWGLNRHRNILRITPGDKPAGTIQSAHSITGGSPCVADQRREHYQTNGHYGVLKWSESAGTVSASLGHDNGRGNIADPRPVDIDCKHIALPQPREKLICRIIALDGTWHRPFTTLELCALQSIVDPEEAFGVDGETGRWFLRKGFDLDGGSDAMRREWIGNAVPSAAAKAMAETIGQALILARLGETFTLSSQEIWVKPLALALSVDSHQIAYDMEMGRL